MDGGLELGKSMPDWLLFPATFLAILILVYPFYQVRSVIARYTLFALSFRYLAGAHHAITFQASPIGISWNAVGSSTVFVFGLLLIRVKHLLLKPAIPFYVVLGTIVLSAYANHDLLGSADAVVRFAYLLIITISVYETLSARGEERTMSLLLWAMVVPLMFQALSLGFGIRKGTEDDGGISYVGGYNHEAAFSIVLATGFVIACFATGLKVWVRSALLLIFLSCIVLANYRTTIVAFAPLAFVQFNVDILGRCSRRQRIVIGVVLLAISGVGAVVAGWLMRERLADLVTVLSNPGSLMKAQEFYTNYEKQLMSGRPYIWAGYIDAYLNGGTKNLLVGFGPDSWQGVFRVYAHNTLVSALYETGIFGVVALLSLWTTMLVAVLRVKHGPKGKLVAAHISFLLLAMATMPHWMIEGNILYGVICGYTFYLLLGPVTARQPSKAMAPMVPVLQPSALQPSARERSSDSRIPVLGMVARGVTKHRQSTTTWASRQAQRLGMKPQTD